MFNRRAYEERIGEEIERAVATSSSLILSVWDIDHFKSINDTHGHAAGDGVLKRVASQMQSCLRENDFLARIGGEEFAILLPDTTHDAALLILNGVREAIAARKFSYKGVSFSVTASCGYSALTPGQSAAVLYERADAALYDAKRNGRNQCSGDDALDAA